MPSLGGGVMPRKGLTARVLGGSYVLSYLLVFTVISCSSSHFMCSSGTLRSKSQPCQEERLMHGKCSFLLRCRTLTTEQCLGRTSKS